MSGVNRTRFQAGSVSKLVTAAIVFHLVDQGRLDLDADVNRYLHTWKIPKTLQTRQKPVTLRHLLPHQSGIPGENKLTAEASLVQILSGSKPATNPPAAPTCEPGSQWTYSNIGFVVIQLILEEVTGKPFPTLAEEVVFKPLGMASSTFSYPLPERVRPLEAMPHGSKDGLPKTPAQGGQARTPGGLTTTIHDMAIFTLEVMRAWQGGSTRLISKSAARLLLTRQVKVPTEAFGLASSDGLGAFLDDTSPEPCFFHPGHNYPGTTFVVFAYPSLGKGAVIAANGNIVDRLYTEILAGLSRAYHWPSGQPFRPAK